MIKFSVFYPNEEGKKFDMDYYLNSHIPMIQEKLGDVLKATLPRTVGPCGLTMPPGVG
jgi:hypothetical protein